MMSPEMTCLPHSLGDSRREVYEGLLIIVCDDNDMPSVHMYIHSPKMLLTTKLLCKLHVIYLSVIMHIASCILSQCLHEALLTSLEVSKFTSDQL